MRWALASVLAVGLTACPPATAAITCNKHDDCAGISQGYCSRAELCTKECGSNDFCNDGHACIDAGRREVCLPRCEDDAGCPGRYGCHPVDGVNVCQLEHPLDPIPTP